MAGDDVLVDPVWGRADMPSMMLGGFMGLARAIGELIEENSEAEEMVNSEKEQ